MSQDPFVCMSEAHLPNCQVALMPSGRRGKVARGTNLLETARSLGVELESICGGRQTCGKCQIIVEEGEFPKHAVTSTQTTSLTWRVENPPTGRGTASSAVAWPAQRRFWAIFSSRSRKKAKPGNRLLPKLPLNGNRDSQVLKVL